MLGIYDSRFDVVSDLPLHALLGTHVPESHSLPPSDDTAAPCPFLALRTSSLANP